MAVAGPYLVDVFNNINGLGTAHDTFEERDGPALVGSAFRDMLAQHGLTQIFGICLVHRHFALGEGQVLVDANGTSTAWTLSKEQGQQPEDFGHAYEKHKGFIKPMCWTVDDAGFFRPYEFYFEPYGAGTTAATLSGIFARHTSFFTQFRDLLDRYRLRGIVGLTLVRDSDLETTTLEVTEGNANVTFPLPKGFDLARLPEIDSVEASWKFRDGGAADPTKFCVTACLKNTHIRVHVSSTTDPSKCGMLVYWAIVAD